MKIFVSGATGVIGTRVMPQLLRAGHHVTAVARTTDKAAALERAGAHPLTVDIFDPVQVERAVAGHDVIINLATSIPPSSRALLPGAWRATNRIRREVPPILAHAASRAGVRRFIQESFAPAYPDCGDRWIDESVAIKPARYNRGIADAEEAVRAFHGDGITLRFAYFYGPDSDFTRDMISMVRKRFAPTPGKKEAFVSSISHDDAASAVVAALTVPAGVYNVCDDEPLTRLDYFQSLAETLGVKLPRFAPAWTARLFGSLGETLSRSQRMANRKLRGASSWIPAYPSMREGWRATIAAM